MAGVYSAGMLAMVIGIGLEVLGSRIAVRIRGGPRHQHVTRRSSGSASYRRSCPLIRDDLPQRDLHARRGFRPWRSSFPIGTLLAAKVAVGPRHPKLAPVLRSN